MTQANKTWRLVRAEIKSIMHSPLLYLSLAWLVTWVVLKTSAEYLTLYERLVFCFADPFIIGIALCPTVILLSAIPSVIPLNRTVQFNMGRTRILISQIICAMLTSAFILLFEIALIVIVSLLSDISSESGWGDTVVHVVNLMHDRREIISPLYPITKAMIASFTPLQVVVVSVCLDYILITFYWILGFTLCVRNGNRKHLGQTIVLLLHLLSYYSLYDLEKLRGFLPLGNSLLCYFLPWSISPCTSFVQMPFVLFCWLTLGGCINALFRFEISGIRRKA